MTLLESYKHTNNNKNNESSSSASINNNIICLHSYCVQNQCVAHSVYECNLYILFTHREHLRIYETLLLSRGEHRLIGASYRTTNQTELQNWESSRGRRNFSDIVNSTVLYCTGFHCLVKERRFNTLSDGACSPPLGYCL